MTPVTWIAVAGAAGCALAMWDGRKAVARRMRTLSPYAVITIGFLLSRVLMLAVTMLLRVGMGEPLSVATLYEGINGADTAHFLRLAEFGYQPGTEYENLIVFYPLYPWLMRLLHVVIPDYFLCGMLINNAGVYVASLLLYALARRDYDRATALRAVKYLLIFPFSFFTAGVFTEGLFWALSIGCLWAARSRKYALCALLGALGALTRVQGVLLLIPAVYEAYRQEIALREGSLGARLRAMPWRAWLLPGIALGLGVYLAINAALYGDALVFMRFQSAPPWYHSLLFPGATLKEHWDLGLAYYPGLASVLYFPQLFLFFLGLWALYDGAKKGARTSALLYGFAYMLMTYTSGWMISGGRYMASCVPMFLALAPRGRSETWDSAYTAGNVCQLAFLFFLYLHKYAIM